VIAISFEGISKAYRLGAIGGATLQDDFARIWASVRGKPNPLLRIGQPDAGHRSEKRFWALRDVSFEVKQGEVVGIIGRNGAGKSTLLKILSQVTAPTTGRIRFNGRIASLLEVGTGFHPELTGRENVFLNGAILGMNKAEIRRKLDEIISFSGIEPFIDTPVKRYSSGMKVRLAFAVAAHLEPEILVVDEVLAVGDAEFQKKCIGKMGDVAREGRTILFVSHDLGNVSRLCRTGILLGKGRIEAEGPISKIVTQYTADNVGSAEGFTDLSRRGDRSGSADAQFRSIELLSGSTRSSVFEIGAAFTSQLVIDVHRDVGPLTVWINISTADGTPVYELYPSDSGCVWRAAVGKHRFTITIPLLRLYPGAYVIDLWIGDFHSRRIDFIKGAIRFQIVQTINSGLDRTLDRKWGLVNQPSEWTHVFINERIN
jgi:lipopolysaccharide transport system ATP-binding protein